MTVKSFSPFRSIKYPGFHLLSLVDPLSTPQAGSPTFADRACLLPDYRGVYTSRYLPLSFITLFILLISRRNPELKQPIRLPSYQTPSPTDQEEDVEHWPTGNGGKKWQWSPHSQFSSKPGNTLEPIPSPLRTPHTHVSSSVLNCAEPVLRASLHSSPLLPPDFFSSGPVAKHLNDSYDNRFVDFQRPPPYPHDEDEFDHDPMSPALYTRLPTSTESSSPHSQDGHNADFAYSWLSETPPSYAPDPRHKSSMWWTWSRSFVFLSRRRRVTVSLPVFFWRASPTRKTSLSSYREADWAEKFGLASKRVVMRRSRWSRYGQILRASLSDYWRVCLPVVILWILIFYYDQQ